MLSATSGLTASNSPPITTNLQLARSYNFPAVTFASSN